MNLIEKFLRQINKKERTTILLLLQQILIDHRKVPNIKALQGMKGYFRVRCGNYRIIFAIDEKTKTADIVRIANRNEKTYKGL